MLWTGGQRGQDVTLGALNKGCSWRLGGSRHENDAETSVRRLVGPASREDPPQRRRSADRSRRQPQDLLHRGNESTTAALRTTGSTTVPTELDTAERHTNPNPNVEVAILHGWLFRVRRSDPADTDAIDRDVCDQGREREAALAELVERRARICADPWGFSSISPPPMPIRTKRPRPACDGPGSFRFSAHDATG
jgi:hypothetical protein